VKDDDLLHCTPSMRFPSSGGLLRLDGDDSKVQGLDLGLVFFYFQKYIFVVGPLNQPTL
jgi:hypothetical protein